MREVVDHTAIKYHVVNGDWTEESGEGAVSTWLRTGGAGSAVQLVGCQNDAMAAGALRALAGASLQARSAIAQALVTGVDGNPEFGVPLVDRRRLAATVIIPPVAGRAVELVHAAWTAPDFAWPLVVKVPVRSYPEIGSGTLRALRA
jgi:ABC-type sugar transport system substrate-binding protein